MPREYLLCTDLFLSLDLGLTSTIQAQARAPSISNTSDAALATRSTPLLLMIVSSSWVSTNYMNVSPAS